MLKIGLDKNEAVVTTQVHNQGCGCKKKALIKTTQDQKQTKLQALAKKISKTIYKKAPIF